MRRTASVLLTARALLTGLGLAFVAALIGACAPTPRRPAAVAAPAVPLPSLIPLPATLVLHPGSLRVDAAALLSAEPSAAAEARYFHDLVARTRGLDFPSVGGGEGMIHFALDPAAPAGEEAYRLDVDAHGVQVAARTTTGLFYGGITLWQLLTADGAASGPAQLPYLHIEDAPHFAWRGLMLDVARHFRTVDEVERFLDTMAQHKLNVFHWHLTDDQGWRIEIPKYPQLTRIGGCRIPAGAADRDANGKPAPLCGYYTQAQIREVVAYAAARHITVVPEIEMPGHAQAAIAAYPRLGVTGKRPPVSPDWGIHTWLYNVDDSTFDFLEDVLSDVVALFPGPYVHVGGDEAAKDQWQASAKIQAQMKRRGIADEAHLQAYFTQRIEAWLSAHGRRLIGWDEILEGGLPAQATVMSWRGTQGAIDAARQGHDVVLAPAPFVYFDNIQSTLHDEPPGRGTVVSLQDVYAFEAVPPQLDAEQARHVLGAQGNLWSEHLRTAARVEHAAFPRAAALAEALWTPAPRRDWNGFVARLAPQFARYRALGVDAADSAFAVRIDAKPAAQGATVALSSQAEGGTLRYTLDGSAPTPASPLYTQALTLALPATLSAARFDGDLPLSAPRTQRIDTAALYTRNSDTLEPCAKGLLLRLEDDAPRDGARAVFNTDVFAPCWRFAGALPQGRVSLRARVGQLPYNFQLWHDTKLIVERPKRTPHGELQVLGADCKGEPLALLPLDAALKNPTLTTLQTELALPPDTTALCLVFATGGHDPLWAIDEIGLTN